MLVGWIDRWINDMIRWDQYTNAIPFYTQIKLIGHRKDTTASVWHSPSCSCWTLEASQGFLLCDVSPVAFLCLNLSCSQWGEQCGSRRVNVFQPSFARTWGRPWHTWTIIAAWLVSNCKKRQRFRAKHNSHSLQGLDRRHNWSKL